MSVEIRVLPEHALIIAKACSLLSKLHIGNLADIALIPNTTEDADTPQWRSELSSLSPYITGKATNQLLDLNDKAVPEEARIAHDLATVILANHYNKTEGFAELVSNQISPNQINQV